MAKHYKEKEKEKKTVKQKISNFITIIMLFGFMVLFIISTREIIIWYMNNKENEMIKEEISQAITIDENKKDTEKDKYIVDFEALKKKNSDTVGWLKVNETNVEYIVVQADDNDYYLNRNFEKNYNSGGWIFTDYKNKFDGTDKNIVIYGHNMRDGSMFGSLKNILKEKWYNNKDNYKITFITENEILTYEVFSVYQIEKEDYYIKTNFNDEIEFEDFVDTIKGRSIKDFKVDVTGEDSILTLSTCANDNKYRVVLHAKKQVNKNQETLVDEN